MSAWPDAGAKEWTIRAMRDSKLPWPAIILEFLTLLLLYLDGAGLLMVALTGAFWTFSLLAVWWWCSDQAEPDAPREIEGNARQQQLEQGHMVRRALISALEGTGAPMMLVDRARIIDANAAARSALGEHILGQDPRIALRHPDAIRLLDSADDETATASIRGLTRSGSLWQLTRRPVYPGLWVIEARDRTAEADISRAHTDFVANASHELRTPLSSVIGYVETISESVGKMDGAVMQRFLGTVLREARRMQALLNDLMSLSQLEAEKHDAPTSQIDLAPLAARVVGEFAPPPGNPARVEFAKPEGSFEVAGDVKQIEQVLRNLIDNALKYGDADQPVTVALTHAPRGMAEFLVTDRGAGISADHLPHLTRRFYRTDPGRSRAAGGTGLGLAIVKHVVERHRGKLDITSKVGVGTKVSVRLPLIPAKEQKVTSPS
ncbi:two-component system phosphate regulon sensor histidine kinase PhoR [Novosphingobium sediminicola]|uniref:histidine kinase n=2 Tax=Novosphingobium sediminicola TaxID=563162 RepID=A0A7W6CIX0_9SPHN|nr:two-component system phosphate regulon sensor histidine kinase PhoR [Novosphingobium sediminicola]